MSQVTRGVTETQDARQLRRRLRLGEVLVSEGLTSEAEIHVALSQQKKQKSTKDLPNGFLGSGFEILTSRSAANKKPSAKTRPKSTENF